jgi:DNA mismatch repair protein MutL
LGFGIREFGPGTVIVDAIPSNLTDWGEGEIFNKIVNELLEEKEERDSLQEAVAASYACHTSIRAGQKLTDTEMQNIIQQLLNAREPFVCPHGRPIMLKVPLKRLDRMFGRS